METYLDCVPCFVRQAVDSARRTTDDPTVHEKLLREVLRVASTMDMREPPPAMGQRIHRLLRELSGQPDPYRRVKDEFNQLACELLDEYRSRIRQSAHPLEAAARLAIAGNLIDLGVKSHLGQLDVREALEQSLSAPFDAEMDEFARAIASSKSILYLADNAGEIVLDRLLVEQLPLAKTTLAVRGAPVINDATLVDAEAAGLTELVTVIDNGSDAPGTILSDCSEDFQQRFARADLVIAKGQGNYETLSGVEKDIFFALKAKCPVIAQDLGCRLGEMVLQRSNSMASRHRQSA